MYTSHKL